MLDKIIEKYQDKLKNDNVGTTRRDCYMEFLDVLEKYKKQLLKDNEKELEILEMMGVR